jgi:hypothetical protein
MTETSITMRLPGPVTADLRAQHQIPSSQSIDTLVDVELVRLTDKSGSLKIVGEVDEVRRAPAIRTRLAAFPTIGASLIYTGGMFVDIPTMNAPASPRTAPATSDEPPLGATTARQ